MKKILLIALVVILVGGFFLYYFRNGLMGMQLASKWSEAYPIVNEPLADLKDLTAAPSAQKVSYYGVEFAVPWNDLDGTQERTAPEDTTLTFRSGIKIRIARASATEFVGGLTPGHELGGLGTACLPERSVAFYLACRSWSTTPRSSEAIFGKETTLSDYAFLKRVLETTPDKIDKLHISSEDLQRDAILLAHKGSMMAGVSRHSLLNVVGPNFKGFQEDSPKAAPTSVSLMLFDDQGAVYIDISQKSSTGATLSQADVNLIVQSLRRVTEAPSLNKSGATTI